MKGITSSAGDCLFHLPKLHGPASEIWQPKWIWQPRCHIRKNQSAGDASFTQDEQQFWRRIDEREKQWYPGYLHATGGWQQSE